MRLKEHVPPQKLNIKSAGSHPSKRKGISLFDEYGPTSGSVEPSNLKIVFLLTDYQYFADHCDVFPLKFNSDLLSITSKYALLSKGIN